MRSTLLLLFVLLLFVTALQAQSVKDGNKITDWTFIFGGNNGTLYYGPIVRNEDIVKVWFKLDFPNGSDAMPGGGIGDFGSIRGYGEFRCAEKVLRTAPALVLYYDRAGKLIKSQKEREQVKDNRLNFLFEYFCEQDKKMPLDRPRLKEKSPNSPHG